MFICHICRFPTELDDVVFRLCDETVVCLRCYEHEVRDERQVSKKLRDDAEDGARQGGA